jgi:large subunit ribosomal protein L21
MKYAIINVLGKQQRVQEGDQLVVDRIAEADFSKDKLVIDKVLLLRTDSEVKIGTPYVAGATVTLKHLNDQRGEKIEVRQFRAKSRYRRHLGHRQEQTVLEVAEISA